MGDCKEIQPKSVNISTFIHVDLKDKSLSGIIGNESKKTGITDDHLILQGDENDRVWSTMVNRDTGKMSGSVSGDNYGFLLFGACTLLSK